MTHNAPLNTAPRTNREYVGRFAPSPTGPIHAGSIAAALASYLDARAHRGKWLLRIEDIDPPREQAGAANQIISVLQAFGLHPDGPVTWQHDHFARYQSALDKLQSAGLAYRCRCSRKTIKAQRLADGLSTPSPGEELAYCGTCRHANVTALEPHSWRLNTANSIIDWHERRDGSTHREELAESCGDFNLRRRDGLWSYQLAVVVDDGADGITDIVRGNDLSSNTARQCLLQEQLGLERPRYQHIPIVKDAAGVKLSKQSYAPAIALPANQAGAVQVLNDALFHLGFAAVHTPHLAQFWPRAIGQWACRFGPPA